MSAHADAIITAGLRPDLFAGRGVLANSRTLIFAAVVVLTVAGFVFRVHGLSAESLSEDELNKLTAVADYRANGLTGANGEHPMLMKALQAATIILAEKWNGTSFVAARPSYQIAAETALRLPGAIVGALSTILIFLIASELFGSEVGLIAAALWAFDPMAIGFNRIAKEDSFLLFFFLLANVFWLRGQRVAESTDSSPNKYYWLTAASYGAMVASKYLPHLFAISLCYYWMFQNIPETRWRLGKKRILTFFAIMGLVFLILSPTVLLPETWRQMGLFAGGNRVVHDGYEFMNQLYPQRVSAWLNGIPVYFYFVFTAVKLPVLTVLGFVAGLPLLFRRKLGDGRYFILFWFLLWVVAFCFPGGKFTRYYTTILPAVLITSALGIQLVGRWLANRFSDMRHYGPAILALIVITGSVINSVNAAPHFRLFTNPIGGGTNWAGYYFPHDEFYDASMRDVMTEIAKRARTGARVASESPSLASYYAERENRSDLVCISFSDPDAVKQLAVGDYVIVARGRRYFSNDAIISTLRDHASPVAEFKLGPAPSAKIYELDQPSLSTLQAAIR
ncbi:MAG TPA: glycosyltransferase family 39 protein [Pyrinomonadaceae bacterium]|nr:glycosyltransferase family 39 protein [Pyrinomonadaceae bacterium]